MTIRISKPMTAVCAALLGAALLVGAVGAQQAPPDAVRKAFVEADTNKDGVLNIDEYIANVIYVFKIADTNRDGFVTEQEAIAFNPTFNPALFKAADRNGDGKLSVGEAVAAKVIDFFEIDTNRDGVLSYEEVIVYERALVGAGARK
jgi:hypothetical protein